MFSQVPGPGTLVSDDDKILLSFRRQTNEGETSVTVPDLRGLSIRKARRMLLELGLKSRINGSGTIKSQTPRAGRSIKAGGTVKLDC